MSAQTEQLKPVAIDPVATPPGDLRHGFADAAVLDFSRSSAARADDVVMVGPSAMHVGVIAIRQVEPLDDPQLDEQVEGPEQRCPTDSEATYTRRHFEFSRCEVAVVFGDQVCFGPPRRGTPVPAGIHRFHDLI